MKILIFSDIHLHNWQYGATYSDGWNSRLLSQENVLNQIIDSALEENVKKIIFCGDLFHTHGKLTASVIDVAQRFFYNASRHADILLLVGNHDMADRGGRVNSVDWLGMDNNIFVVKHKNGVHFNEDGVGPISLLPYTEDKEILESFLKRVPNGNTVFMHQGVRGQKMGNGFVLPNEIFDPKMIKPDRNLTIFTGHYHEHKEILMDNQRGRVIIVGATMQHNWSDIGQDRGWLIYDTKTGKYERHYSRAPKFIEDVGFGYRKTGSSESWDSDISGNFIKVIDYDKNKEKYRQNLLKGGALSVEFVGSEKQPNKYLDADPHDFSVDSVIKAYEKLNKLSNELIKVGQDIRTETYETPNLES